MSLKKQAVSGLIWTFAQQFGAQLISFTVGIILARILLPSDFGVIAMFGVVIALAGAIIDGGMASSLIRTKEIDQSDLSTVFWFNIATSFLLYIIIFITAPFIAQFYKVEILTPVIRVYSLTLIISSFGSVQNMRFVKDMDFRTGFKIQLPSLIIGGISGVIMAWKGLGIWTLVFYPLIQSTISVIQLWLYSKWRPSFIFDKVKFKYHFNYGYKLTISDLLNTLFKNSYTIIIGKYFSPTDLGFYNRADSLKQLPVSNLSTALNKVTFPLFAKISNDDGKLREVYKRLMKVVIFIIAPILCLMAAVAEPLIRFILTDKWLPSVPYFQVLVIAGILYPVHAYNLNILKVKGRTDLFFKLEIYKKILMVLVLIFSVHFGVMGIVWGQILTSTLAFFINSYYTGKILNYTSIHQSLDLLPTILLAGIIGIGVYYIDQQYFEDFPDYLRLLVIGVIFAMAYLSTVYMLKFKEINYIKELIKR